MSTRDRRNQEKIIYYQPAPQTEDQQGGDLQQFLSFILCFVGIMTKQKICLWVALFMFLSNFANIKQTSDLKQMIINAGIIVMGMVSLYYWGPKLEEQQLQAQMAQQSQAAAAASEPVLEEKFEQ
ncbi:hypothetical protein ABPG72_007448 [Tetrahymena utriculariae]